MSAGYTARATSGPQNAHTRTDARTAHSALWLLAGLALAVLEVVLVGAHSIKRAYSRVPGTKRTNAPQFAGNERVPGWRRKQVACSSTARKAAEFGASVGELAQRTSARASEQASEQSCDHSELSPFSLLRSSRALFWPCFAGHPTNIPLIPQQHLHHLQSIKHSQLLHSKV